MCSVRASTDAESITFGLFKCTDLLGAYAAAKAIIADYASGKTSISEIDLAGSKSTVAYSVIQGTATRLSAAAAAWQNGYEGKGVDYGKWLLTQVDTVTPADALHALKKYIVPLFDEAANVAATCPTNKLDADADGLREALGVPVRKLVEDQLYSAFDAPGAVRGANDGLHAPKGPAPKRGAGAFSFAKQFKCECPKCEVPPPPAI